MLESNLDGITYNSQRTLQASYSITLHLSVLSLHLVKRRRGEIHNTRLISQRFCKHVYTVFRPLSQFVLLSIFDMYHQPLGWCCSYCEAQLATRTSDIKQAKISRLRGRNTVYTCYQVRIIGAAVILISRRFWGSQEYPSWIMKLTWICKQDLTFCINY